MHPANPSDSATPACCAMAALTKCWSSGPLWPPGAGTGAAAVPASAPDLMSDAVAVIASELLDESG